ncbi:hypothetical protein FGRMN_2100 [Fusarium graminum]|nr:hypothetical protein FGRMN_2100 [Fusarium graminum]
MKEPREFNQIARRQWGSSLYHNGFGFFPATVPMGTTFYHGARTNVTPSGLEWLALDIEHSGHFARSFRKRPDRGRPPQAEMETPEMEDVLPGGQEAREELRRRSENRDVYYTSDREDEVGELTDPNDAVNFRGYLHTYQTNREFNVLLVDGMSAGKTSMGTLDSQDLVLRENNTNHNMDEWHRALDLCKLATEWGLDGFVRMELGVEIIKCDFGNGLDLVSMVRTEMYNRTMGRNEMARFQWARAVAERYDGVGADRLRIDFSSMVSGLFFPINISSTTPERPDLKRLGAATLDELRDIKAYLRDMLRQPRRFTVNWQGVADLIINRYSKRLTLMVYEPLSLHFFVDEIEAATLTWVDAPPLPDDVSMAEREGVNRTADAIEPCRVHYLRTALAVKKRWNIEDELIYTSLDTVLGTICQTLFLVRSRLLEASGSELSGYKIKDGFEGNGELEKAAQNGRATIQELIDNLGWSTWKRPQPCAPDETSMIAMWPFGTKEDHWHPGCRSIDTFQHPTDTYWDLRMARGKV